MNVSPAVLQLFKHTPWATGVDPSAAIAMIREAVSKPMSPDQLRAAGHFRDAEVVQ